MKPEIDPLMVKISPDHHQSSPSADTFTKPKSKLTISSLQLVVASLIFLAVTLGLLSVSYPSLFSRLNLRTSSAEERYSIIIDAGSSGSRVHVFRYLIDASKNPVFDFADDINHQKLEVTPDLSSYANNPEAANVKIKKLVEFAKGIVLSEEMRKKSEIWLMATAGMRLIKDDTIREAILEATREVLRASGFKFDEEKGALVISGADEGKYAWVAANYANKKLGGLPSETSGIVELGGASAQVAFVTKSNHVSEADTQTVKYGNVDYKIYCHSFLHLGQNEARKELEKLLREKAEKSEKDVTDPCYPNDAYPAKSSSPTTTITAKGDFSKCEIETDALLRESNANCPKNTHCSIDSMYTPDLKGNFFALASFYYTPRYFNMTETDWMYDMIPKATTFCEENWSTIWENRHKVVDEVEQQKIDEEQKEHLLGYCFSAAYTISMLHERLHFALEGDRIKFVKKVNNIPVDWPVGVLILATQKPSSDEHSGISRKILG